MTARNVWSTILALAAGIATTAIVGVAAKARVEDGDLSAFIMAALFASVLFWLPIRAVVGIVGRLTNSTNS